MARIPMLDLRREYEYMKPSIDAAIERCLGHQQWILGPELKEFEEAVAAYLRVKHFIGVSSGTDALILSLRALAIKDKGNEYFDVDDEIITTPFTFIATGEAIIRAGATPVFVDINPASLNICAERIKEYLERGPRKVAGIAPVHLYGRPCGMHDLNTIADEEGLFIVEDVAQAFGGKWGERALGAYGAAGAFSFFPSKNLGGFGDGGGISTDDDETADIIRALLKHGGRDKYNAEHVGYNARLDTIQAAILIARMEHVDDFNERRRSIARLYQQGLGELENVICPEDELEAYNVYNQYTIRVINGWRDKLKDHLRSRGIATMVYYPIPLNRMKVFEGHSTAAGALVESEKASREVLSLPIEPLFSKDEVLYVVDAIRGFWD